MSRINRFGAPLAPTCVMLAALASLTACANSTGDTPDPARHRGGVYTTDPNRPTIFGEGGVGGTLFGGPEDETQQGGGIGIGVNFYLWRATLDTISFMPLASADPFGGIIITDWYAAPSAPDERYKLTVYILSRELRADGLRVSVFRQRRDGSDSWIDTPVDPATSTALEDTILTRARQMRIAAAQ